MPIYTIALQLTILLAFWLWLGAWQRERGTPGRNTFAALTVAAIAWCLGDILKQGQIPEIIADRIRYVGILSLPPLWLAWPHTPRASIWRAACRGSRWSCWHPYAFRTD